ncbi:MAG: DUF1559 domain-containing protein [Lentisphaeraceae bacterium]|nr:DUF1559 domain-containing protein [Lentisphaeraceae bacterium]
MIKLKRNFTLIELLTVISILGILASLLLPSIKDAREKTKSVVCLSNLKQIGVGFMQFSINHDAKLPAWAQANNESTFMAYGNPSVMWDENIASYLGITIKNPELGSRSLKEDVTGPVSIFSCPSDEVVRAQDNSYPSSYGYNRGGLGVHDFIRVTAVEKPSQVLSTSDTPMDTHYFGYATNSEVTPEKQRRNYLGMHLPNGSGEKYNYLFIDGHSQNLSLQSTLGNGTITSPKGYWTIDSDD